MLFMQWRSERSLGQAHLKGLMPSHLPLSAWLGLAALAVLAVVAVPQFLCMPLWADATLYDLCARNVLDGGVHYRDAFETNLPGMVWLHIAVRSALGWRPETLRAVDLAVVSGIVALLLRWLAVLGCSVTRRVWCAVALYSAYFSVPEICHVQRDVWMLLPVLAAAYLRYKQVMLLAAGRARAPALVYLPFAEGILWGVGVWIKPFVLFVGLVCWATSVVLAARGRKGVARPLAVNAGALVAGGLFIGAVGVGWLWRSGSWPYFWDTMTHWNGEYWTAWRGARLEWIRVWFVSYPPWVWALLVAVPAAAVQLVHYARRFGTGQAQDSWSARVLLAALFLGWVIEAFALQAPHPYIFFSAVLPAIALVAAMPSLPRVFVWLALLAMALNPMLRPARLATWGECVRSGSTPALRDKLQFSQTKSWTSLDRVATFLREQGVGDRDVLCYGNFTHSLYLDLNIRPATRFYHIDQVLRSFPHHTQLIRQDFEAGGARYVVADLPRMEGGWGDDELRLPDEFPEAYREVFPWYEPVVFKAGRYTVHRVTRPIGKLRLED